MFSVCAVDLRPGGFDFEVEAECEAEQARFRIQNIGSRGPKPGVLAIYRRYGEHRILISKRRLRLKQSRRTTFDVKPTPVAKESLGLWFDPGWFERHFACDATVDCAEESGR